MPSERTNFINYISAKGRTCYRRGHDRVLVHIDSDSYEVCFDRDIPRISSYTMDSMRNFATKTTFMDLFIGYMIQRVQTQFRPRELTGILHSNLQMYVGNSDRVFKMTLAEIPNSRSVEEAVINSLKEEHTENIDKFTKTLEEVKRIKDKEIEALEEKLKEKHTDLPEYWVFDENHLNIKNTTRLLCREGNWCLAEKIVLSIKYMLFSKGFTETLEQPIETEGWLIKYLQGGEWLFLDDNGKPLVSPDINEAGILCLGDSEFADKAVDETHSYDQFYKQVDAVKTILQTIDMAAGNMYKPPYFDPRLDKLVLKNYENRSAW